MKSEKRRNKDIDAGMGMKERRGRGVKKKRREADGDRDVGMGMKERRGQGVKKKSREGNGDKRQREGEDIRPCY